MNVRRTGAVLALAALFPIVLAACGSSDDTADNTTTPMGTTAPMTEPTSASPAMGGDAMNAGAPFGAACSEVPADGAGSFAGMATEPVATAASQNPLLSTLVAAVTAAGLGDTLNSAPELTVFAPINSAFAKIPAADLNALLADKTMLTTVLTGHVVAGKIPPSELAGQHETLAGTMITVTGSGESFQVGSGQANVICGNVTTANATVYLIDSVLLPS